MMKEIYPSRRVESLAKRKRPLLNWLPEKDAFYGDAYVVPVLHDDPQGRSASLATAITNNSNTSQTKFVITERKKDYQAWKIEGEAIMAASKDVGSFVRAKQTQINGALRNLGKSLHLALYRSGSGSIGQVATGGISDGSGEATIVLTNFSDCYNFGIGQTVVANDTDNDTSVKSGSPQITNIQHSTGTLTVDETVVATYSWAAADYIFNAGDPDAKVAGLSAWIPLTAPSATPFFSVDRTVNEAALSGHRVDNSGRSILENGQELAMLIGEFGGEPDAWFMNPRAGLQLAEQLDAQVERMDGGHGSFGFTGFTLNSFVTGSIKVIFDIGCPPNLAWMLQRNTWEFACMGKVPHIIRDDGLTALRGSTTDDVEYRARYFGELVCYAPGFNGVMSIATA